MTDLLRLEDAVERLREVGGGTPGGVADYLIEAGFRGFRENCDACPIAKYLLWATGLSSVTVEPRLIQGYPPFVDSEDGVWPYPEEVHPLPPALDSFIEAFDGGQYPELDEAADVEEFVIGPAN